MSCFYCTLTYSPNTREAFFLRQSKSEFQICLSHSIPYYTMKSSWLLSPSSQILLMVYIYFSKTNAVVRLYLKWKCSCYISLKTKQYNASSVPRNKKWRHICSRLCDRSLMPRQEILFLCRFKKDGIVEKKKNYHCAK